jgi:hypothetical protein
MAGLRGVYVYHSDDGNAYNVNIDAGNAVAAAFVAATAGATPNKPRSYHMRYVLARNPTSGRERRIYIPTAANAMFVGGTNVISIEDFSTSPSATVVSPIAGRIGERRLAH